MYNISFKNIVQDKIEKCWEKNKDSFDTIADIVVNAHNNGNKIFVVGSGHSHMFAEELYARAGGLNIFTPILEPELMLHEHPFKSTLIERENYFAHILDKLYKFSKNDIIFIVSNSGINALPNEIAIMAKSIGMTSIGITNATLADKMISRHDSNKVLAHNCDYVIDNCGDYGDTAIQIEGLKEMIAPTSTIINSFIAQELLVSITYKMKDQEIPVFESANTNKDNFEKNENIFESK